MAKKPPPLRKMDIKQPANRDRSNNADCSGTDRGARERERRTGEGSESALAKLKNIERDRQRSRPGDDDSPAR